MLKFMSLPTMIATSEGGNTVFSTDTVDFIFDGVSKFLDLFTSNPILAIFLTIGIIGSIVSLTAGIIHTARRGH